MAYGRIPIEEYLFPATGYDKFIMNIITTNSI